MPWSCRPASTSCAGRLKGALPRVRIEDLLTQVDAWCHFTQAFRHAGERAPRVPHFFTTLLATLIAHGTNLGLAMMAHSVEDGITADMLQEMSQWCLREETLKAANARLVNFHHRLPLSAVWGDGTVSSSDGQRFGLQASSAARLALSALLRLLRSRADGVYACRRPAQRVSYPGDCLCPPRSHLCAGWALSQRYDPAAEGAFCRSARLYGSALWAVSFVGLQSDAPADGQ